MARAGKRGLVVLSLNRMFRAALAPALERENLDVLLAPEMGPDVPYVEVIHCPDDRPETWLPLRSGNDLNRIGFVVLVDSLTEDNARRALSRGAVPVLVDSDPAHVADVIARWHAGHICVPAGLLAGFVGTPTDSLSDAERGVLRLVAAGETLEQVAARLHYSDRHVRRILQAVLVKAGTTSRAVAAEVFEAEIAADTRPERVEP